MDISKLSRGDQIIGVSGIALFIFSFFKWLGYSFKSSAVPTGFNASYGAWSFTLCWLAVIIGIALVAYVALKAAGVKLPDLGGVTWAQVVLGLAAVALLFVLIKLVAGPSSHGVDLGAAGISKSRKIGIFLGLIASAGLTAGAFLNFQAEKGGGGAMPPPPRPPSA
jgi:hypothetical protein